MFIRSISVTLVSLMLCVTAEAGELQDIAGKAETQAKAEQYAEAFETMREALYLLWGKSPLHFRRAFFVTQKASGFGVFKKRTSNEFKQGEPLLIYVEPAGYGWRQDGPIYQSEVTADFELREPNGNILGGQKDFASFNFRSHDRNIEYFMNLTYNLSGIRAGKYIIGTQFRDKVSGKSASFDLPFEVK